MADKNQQYAYLRILGSFDPAEITTRVGVVPTECWRQGDAHPRMQRARRFSKWALHSRLDRDQELEAHIRDVLAQLDAKRLGFQQVSQEFGGCMQLVGYFDAGFPGLMFDRDIIGRLAMYSLSVDIDFYGLHPESEET